MAGRLGAKRRVKKALARFPATRRRLLFARAHKRALRLRHPVTFNEKVNWRIVHDRRPELAWTCDKLEMKARAAAVGALVPRTLWVGTDVAGLVELDHVGEWVLKPNHRTGLAWFGRGAVEDPAGLAKRTKGWLDETLWSEDGEWAYSRARRCLLVEERVGRAGGPPDDIKILVFRGEPTLIQFDRDRFEANHRRCYYGRDWEYLGFTDVGAPLAEPVPRPPSLDEALELARELSCGLDFLRVDFYIEAGDVYFGEVSPYPGGGLDAFTDRDADGWLGSLWRLPEVV